LAITALKNSILALQPFIWWIRHGQVADNVGYVLNIGIFLAIKPSQRCVGHLPERALEAASLVVFGGLRSRRTHKFA
jgi:hypothetical protein